jgi:hypothetical protein
MSEVKVNKISPRTNCGTVTVGDSGDSVTVSTGVPVTVNNNLTVSGDLKSAALKASDGGNIINQCGTTITLGASGDTVSLASGASQTGFGRTGTVDWDTTPKTASFTAVDGDGYFINTSSSAITMTLPSGSAGSIVSAQDYNNSFATNNLTVLASGTDKINGGSAGGDIVLNTNGEGVTLVYIDSTVGWRSIHQSVFTDQSEVAEYVVATGGTVTCCGDWKIHTFTGPGCFQVTAAGNSKGWNKIDYMVVAGGGGSGYAQTGDGGGGGGGGGFRESSPAPGSDWTDSPLGNPGGGITASVTTYPITIGGGGSVSTPGSPSPSGSNSVFSTITSAGGGGGGGSRPPTQARPGGSGGGGGGYYGPQGAGSGNSPPVSPPQGTPGGNGSGPQGGGGGGATDAGGPGNSPGTGATTNIPGSPITKSAGGHSNSGPQAGAANSGNGGSTQFPNGGAGGGSGIVVLRYKYQ